MSHDKKEKNGPMRFRVDAWYANQDIIAPLLPLNTKLNIFFVENQCHILALQLYYSVSTARCVFAMSPSLRRNSWNENEKKRLFSLVWTGPKLRSKVRLLLEHWYIKGADSPFVSWGRSVFVLQRHHCKNGISMLSWPSAPFKVVLC